MPTIRRGSSSRTRSSKNRAKTSPPRISVFGYRWAMEARYPTAARLVDYLFLHNMTNCGFAVNLRLAFLNWRQIAPSEPGPPCGLFWTRWCMSIKVTCPNGHALQVRANLRGNRAFARTARHDSRSQSGTGSGLRRRSACGFGAASRGSSHARLPASRRPSMPPPA